MVTVLITSFLLLAVIIYAVYRRQETQSIQSAPDERRLQPDPGWSGLFNEETARQDKQLALEAKSLEDEKKGAELLSRAAEGQRSVLAEARASGDAALYNKVLNRLVEQARTPQKLLALVSYMMRETPALSVNRQLAERFLEAWKAAPDRGSTAKMLHIVALADDADIYRQAVETALEFWRRNRIPNLSAEELRQLSESEYWILSQNTRSSGEGFLLKLKLAALRRELSAKRGATTGTGDEEKEDS
jgi:hypothetical protein